MRSIALSNVAMHPRLAVIVLLVVMAAILGGCDLFGSEEKVPTRVVPQRTLRPPDTPTPTPAPPLSVAQVQQLVFQAVSPCAQQVSLSGEITVQLDITAVYSLEDKRWVSEVANEDGTLSFGRWQVPDATGIAAALAEIASAIASPAITCDIPVALLATGLTPPLLLAPTATPVPTSAVTTAEQAQLRVWIAVFNCYDHFPALESFTAYEDSPLSWVVEGKSDITQYGLWLVDIQTGEISPADQLAEKAAATCELPAQAAFPAVVAALQAELLVWAAVYDCFEVDYPQPKTTIFTAYQDNPQRWLVEGREDVIVKAEGQTEVTTVGTSTTESFVVEREETVFYGLWLVDTSTGAITPWDALARTTAFNPCFQVP